MSRDPYVVVHGQRFPFSWDIDGPTWDKPIPLCPSCDESMGWRGPWVQVTQQDSDGKALKVECPCCEHVMEVSQ